jgi:hypothetical protein
MITTLSQTFRCSAIWQYLICIYVGYTNTRTICGTIILTHEYLSDSHLDSQNILQSSKYYNAV